MRGLVFAVAIFLVGTTTVFSQSLDVKPGLWESRSVDEDGTVTKTRECMTAEQFRQQLAELQHKPGCKASLSTATAKQTVLEVACQIQAATLKMRAQQDAITNEHVTAIISSTWTINGKPATSTVKGDAHFVNASCGNVKAGEPQTLE